MNFWQLALWSMKAPLKNRSLFIFSLIPMVLCAVFYYFVFSKTLSFTVNTFHSWLNSDKAGFFGTYILPMLVFLIVLVMANYTLIIVVSLFSAPFNDILSKKVEQLLFLEEKLNTERKQFERTDLSFKQLMKNEFSKIVLVLFLSLFAVGLSFIPFLVILSMVITPLVFSLQFIDYAYSRRHMNWKQALYAFRLDTPFLLVSGAIFSLLFAIPILGGFLYAFVVIFYSARYYLWEDKNAQKIIMKVD